MEKLRGLVLSGGESRRMGQDKGLMVSDKVTWVNRAGAWLRELDLPVSIMIRESQREDYLAAVDPTFELLPDLDLPVHGPLRGLLSFYRLYPASNVLVIPCDMPNLSIELLSDLIHFCTSNPAYDAWVFEDSERLQPFPGIYAAVHLDRIWRALQTNTLLKTSLMYVLESGNTARKKVPATLVPAFANANSPQDLAQGGQ